MQTLPKFLFSAMRVFFLSLFFIGTLICQNSPFVVDHQVYYFLQRQETLGNINGQYSSTLPYTYNQILRMLDEVETHRAELHINDARLLDTFQAELNRDVPEEDIVFPWQSLRKGGFIKDDTSRTKPFFLSYQKSDALGWINWSETFRLQYNGEGTRGYYTDHFGIHGRRGAIDFTTQFTYFRVTKSAEFPNLPDSYKEGYVLIRDNINWINWDYPTSSLVYSHADFSLGIHRQPIKWGYSMHNSPILSNNVYPLPHISWETQIEHLRYKYIHGRLSGTERPVVDSLNTRRNLSAHRVEFDITPNFEFSFSELIIYAYRDFELAYLNPVNFLFAEEHVQGDLDNLLMALDFKWRAAKGITTYGTWLFDELNWFEFFTGWWGNKFVFQLGIRYEPQSNLPSLSLEYTMARPWTYSHQYPINSFTSAGRVLGLPVGPNSKHLELASNWQMSPAVYFNARIEHLIVGDHPGADPLNSYNLVGDFDHRDGTFLVGELSSTTRWEISGVYRISRVISMALTTTSEGLIESSVKLDW